MSPLPFILVSFAASAGCLVARRQPKAAAALGLVALAALTALALLIAPGELIRLGSADLVVGTPYARLFLALASATGLIVCLIGLATTWPADLPPAVLAGVGGIGLGLTVTDPLVALVILLATAIAISLAALPDPVRGGDAGRVARYLRPVGLAGALAIVALAWASPAVAGIGGDPQAFGLADLAIVLAVAVRFGAIPFHRPVAGLSTTAPGPAIPLLLVWCPAALAVIAIGVTDGTTNPLLVPSGVGQAVIVAIAAATLLLGAVGGWLQDDLEHVVGYSVVQNAGFILLGLAVAGGGGETNRTWLLILVVTTTAFAAWASVIQARFRTARLPELGGWARRSPVLGGALAGIAVASIGVPGLLVWQVRWSLINGAASGPLALVLVIGGLAALAYYGRILAIGFGRVSLLAEAAPSERPVSPERGRNASETIRNGWLANRAPIATGLVLVLVVISVVVAAGGLGGPEAARAAGPLASPIPAQPLISPGG